jgi:tRNA threonylcarbamoyl adenosine modification protein (Sua5/YciO/YrdC/YwlC family)
LDTATIALLKKIFPGPYTAVLPCNAKVPLYIQKNQLVGIRIPEHRFCNAITDMLGEPIITTSCNLTGHSPLLSAVEIEDNIGHLLDLVVDCGQPVGSASTVVNLAGDQPTLLRQGVGKWPLDLNN